MTRRVCYIHVGPQKTGTTSVQWFLQENRAELLEHGYFVPESETKRGAHHSLPDGLAGLDLGQHREHLHNEYGANAGPKFLCPMLARSLRRTILRCANRVGLLRDVCDSRSGT
jgi:hypothetical protein